MKSPLPALSDPGGSVLIDGTSAPGYVAGPVVVLDGSWATEGFRGLTVRSASASFEGRIH